MNRPLDVFSRSSVPVPVRTTPAEKVDRPVPDTREAGFPVAGLDRFVRSSSPEPRSSGVTVSQAPLAVLGNALVAGLAWVGDRVEAAFQASTELAADVTSWVIRKGSEWFRFLTQLIERDRITSEQRSRESQKALDEVRHIQNHQLREALTDLDRQALDQSKRLRQVTAAGQEAALRDQVLLGLTDDDDVQHHAA
jgi:hypothetical protein